MKISIPIAMHVLKMSVVIGIAGFSCAATPAEEAATPSASAPASAATDGSAPATTPAPSSPASSSPAAAPPAPVTTESAPAAPSHCDEARDAAKAHNHQQAIELFTKCIEAHPDDKELLRERGVSRLYTGDYSEAYKDFVAAGYKSGPFDEAINFVPKEDEPVEYPDWLRALAIYQVGKTYSSKGDFPSALKFYGAALKIVPVFPECLASRAYCATAGYTTRARRDASAAISYRPDNWETWRALAEILVKEDDPKKAAALTEQAIQVATKSKEPMHAEMLTKLKKFKEALSQ